MQPTAYFEGTAAFIGQEFYIEYEFDNSIIYRNMAGAAAQEGPMAYEDGQDGLQKSRLTYALPLISERYAVRSSAEKRIL